MTTEAAFLADIAEHPDDDAPRLVFADWLEDQGRGPQGEFIRVQCELERLDPSDPRVPVLRGREKLLLSRYGHTWARAALGRRLPRHHGEPAWTFRRGMIESLALSCADLTRASEALSGRLPIRHLKLIGFHQLQELPPVSVLGKLSGLELHGDVGFLHEQIPWLGVTNPFPRLRTLRITASGLTTEIWRALAGALEPGQLEHLGLGGHRYRPRSAPIPLGRVLGDPATSRLRRLELHGQATGEPLHDLCTMPGVGRLQELSLSHVRLEGTLRPEERRPRGLLSSLVSAFRRRPVAAGPGEGLTTLLARLRSLTIDYSHVSEPLEIDDFLALPALSNLHTLDIKGAPQFRDLATALSQAHLARLSTLNLRTLYLRDSGLAALVRASPLTRVTTLDLTDNNLTPDAVPLLTESPIGTSLRWLTLRGNPIGAGARRLIDSALIERLVGLDLRHTQLGEDDTLRLAASAKRLPGLDWLDLRKNAITKPTRDRLREAFGARVQLTG